MNRNKWPLLAGIALLCAAALLAGCGMQGEDKLAVSVTGYNHMSDEGWYIGGFSINGASGPNLQPETGGGFNCCIVIPERWKPGMKAKVEWWYDTRPGGPPYPLPPPQEAEVEIPDYNAIGPGTVQVHFYPDHRVKVVVSRFAIEHTRYPMSEEDKFPWETDPTATVEFSDDD